MDIMKLGAQLLAAKLGGNANNDLIQNAISGLLGGDSKGGLDLASLVGSLQGGGLGNIVESWLGDGDNDEISEQQIESIFGSDKIQSMASELGANQSDVLAGLKDALPQMVDKSSSGGNLLDAVGGISGLAGLASKFLK